MTDKQIIIEDYFNIIRDDYGRIYGIQDIGDTKELIKAIREQNEYIQRKEKENDKLKQVLSEIKGNAYCIMNDDEDEGSCYDRAREIVDKIDEVLND